IGYPVALRTDPVDPSADGPAAQVRLGLGTPAAVRDAFAELTAGGTGPVSVQAMAGAGSAATVGITQDPLFGPLVTLGISAGLGDGPRGRAGRIAPLTDRDAAELAAEALGRARLDGSPWTDAERTAIEDVLLRAGRLAEDLPELAELDINPLIVTPAQTAAGGFRARVAPWAPRPELALRHLN
ncbi:MAG: acetate--CoA ligase family protein, partial [Acidimicrobiales bacterium]